MVPFVSRDVKFYKQIFPLNSYTPQSYMNPVPIEVIPTTTQTYDCDDLYPLLNDTIQSDSRNAESSPDSVELTQPTVDDVEHNDLPVAVRRSQRQKKTPVWMDTYVIQPYPTSTSLFATVANQQVQSTFQCFLSSITSVEDPKSFYQAAEHQH